MVIAAFCPQGPSRAFSPEPGHCSAPEAVWVTTRHAPPGVTDPVLGPLTLCFLYRIINPHRRTVHTWVGDPAEVTLISLSLSFLTCREGRGAQGLCR